MLSKRRSCPWCGVDLGYRLLLDMERRVGGYSERVLCCPECGGAVKKGAGGRFWWLVLIGLFVAQWFGGREALWQRGHEWFGGGWGAFLGGMGLYAGWVGLVVFAGVHYLMVSRVLVCDPRFPEGGRLWQGEGGVPRARVCPWCGGRCVRRLPLRGGWRGGVLHGLRSCSACGRAVRRVYGHGPQEVWWLSGVLFGFVLSFVVGAVVQGYEQAFGGAGGIFAGVGLSGLEAGVLLLGMLGFYGAGWLGYGQVLVRDGEDAGNAGKEEGMG